MGLDDKIQLFEDKRIRTAWDEEKEEWYFSIVDVVAVLTDAPDYQAARNYWKVTKKRLVDEGVESIIKCRRNRYGFSCIIFFIRRQAEGG